MSHLLSTANPDEAARLQETVAAELVAAEPTEQTAQSDTAQPVWRDGDPDVGDWVIYQPRRGMIRRGRNRVAALVVHRHAHARLFDLAIFYEANDTLDDQRVPEAVGDERGWIVKAEAPQTGADMARRVDAGLAELRQDIADIRALIFGTFDQPEVSLLDLLSMLDERVDKMERAKPKRIRNRVRKAKAAPAPKAE